MDWPKRQCWEAFENREALESMQWMPTTIYRWQGFCWAAWNRSEDLGSKANGNDLTSTNGASTLGRAVYKLDTLSKVTKIPKMLNVVLLRAGNDTELIESNEAALKHNYVESMTPVVKMVYLRRWQLRFQSVTKELRVCKE